MFTSRAVTAHRRDRYTAPWLSSVRCLGPVPIVSPFFILSGDSQPARCSNIAATSQVATAPAITSCSFVHRPFSVCGKLVNLGRAVSSILFSRKEASVKPPQPTSDVHGCAPGLPTHDPLKRDSLSKTRS